MTMKKKIFYGVSLSLLIAGGFIAWKIFGPGLNPPPGKYFYIKTGSSYNEVRTSLLDLHIMSSATFFDLVAKQTKYSRSVKAGRYEIKAGMSVYGLVRMLRSGRQTPVNLVITKLRTVNDLAAKIAANFECDSTTLMYLFSNSDSLLKFGLNTNTVMTAVIPNTYSIPWNSSPAKIFRKLCLEKEKFWNKERRNKALDLKLTPEEVFTLASIVDEETNKEEDKGKVASVYINRLNSGQRLDADPTVKFALKNFALKRIRRSAIDACAGSPYNTYYAKGLPPGPICTPSPKTIDAVLNAPVTDYLYFVARPDWTGLSNFTSSYAEHQLNARNYQHFLDSINIR